MHCFIVLLPALVLLIGGCRGEDTPAAKNKCGQHFVGERDGVLNFSTEGKSNVTSGDFNSCSWIIEMGVGHKVALTIKELKLNLNDSLVITEFFDERSDEELSNRRFYVLKPGSVIFSQSNKLKVEMVVQKEHVARFSAVFEDAECGETILEDRGEIQVPMFVHLSKTYHQCKWNIIAPANKIVKVSFSQFYLAPGSCIFEGLTIKDGQSNGVLGDYCEENPPAGSLISPSHSMVVEFTKRPSFETHQLSEVGKISMNYEFVDPCESKIKARFGTISVPHTYAATSPPREVCQWEITVPQGQHISLIFLRYTTGPNVPGQHQEMRIYDGLNEISNTNRQIWSTNDSLLPPFNLITASNTVRIVRTTTLNPLNPNGISFKAFFQAQVNAESQADECVNIGNRRFFQCSNGHYIDCSWKCDGVVDCADGIDEATCPATNFDIVQSEDDKSTTDLLTFVFIVALTGSAFAIFSLVTLINRKVHLRYQRPVVSESEGKQANSQYRYYVDLKHGDLPSYSEVIDAEVMFAIAKSKARKNFDESLRNSSREKSNNTSV